VAHHDGVGSPLERLVSFDHSGGSNGNNNGTTPPRAETARRLLRRPRCAAAAANQADESEPPMTRARLAATEFVASAAVVTPAAAEQRRRQLQEQHRQPRGATPVDARTPAAAATTSGAIRSVLSATDLATLEAYAGPLACARGERELGVHVGVGAAAVSGGGSSSSSLELRAASSPQLAAAIARCFCVVGRVMDKLGGEGCKSGNWRACVEPADGGMLALGVGTSFTSAVRAECCGDDHDGGSDGMIGSDDVAEGTTSIVIWLDPDVCELSSSLSAAGDSAAGLRGARCASSFRVLYGGRSCALQHGTVLFVPPDEYSGGQNLRDMRVEVVGAGGGGGVRRRLVGLHFFISAQVSGACALLGADGVRKSLVVT
jgi:hypothetical protein